MSLAFVLKLPLLFYFLVAKILVDLLEPWWRDRKHPIRFVVSTAGIRDGARLREHSCFGRQTGAKEVVREAGRTPIECSQSYVTPNGNGSFPLHHSPVNEIS